MIEAAATNERHRVGQIQGWATRREPCVDIRRQRLRRRCRGAGDRQASYQRRTARNRRAGTAFVNPLAASGRAHCADAHRTRNAHRHRDQWRPAVPIRARSSPHAVRFGSAHLPRPRPRAPSPRSDLGQRRSEPGRNYIHGPRTGACDRPGAGSSPTNSVHARHVTYEHHSATEHLDAAPSLRGASAATNESAAIRWRHTARAERRRRRWR